jgi:phosphoserine phosphatase
MDPSCKYPCFRNDKNSRDSSIARGKKISLVFFDMDGVLIDVLSSWKYIHDHFGTTNQRSVLSYLKGDIDYYEFMRRDIALWNEHGRAVKKETIVRILSELSGIPGAKDCISFLRKNKVKTAIVSAGLDLLADKVAKDLGIDYVFANRVITDDQDRLTGEGVLVVQLIHKEKNIRYLAKKLGVPFEACAAVGNSCFDIPMFETCGLGIAFNPTDACVRESADIIVEEKDLSRLIPALQPFVSTLSSQ